MAQTQTPFTPGPTLADKNRVPTSIMIQSIKAILQSQQCKLLLFYNALKEQSDFSDNWTDNDNDHKSYIN